MYGLLQSSGYSKNQQYYFEKLYMDSDIKDQLLLRSQLAKKLKDSPNLILSHGTDWILCTLAQNNKPEDETLRIFQSIMNCFDKFSIGILTEKIKWRMTSEIADSCLVGVGFFKDDLESRYKYHGAPSVEYYSKVGATAFSVLGYESIGKEFNEWAEFIREEFII